MAQTIEQPRLDRRGFLRLSVAGTVLAGTAGTLSLLSGCARAPAKAQGFAVLRTQDAPILAALLGVMLAGVLPADGAARATALERTLHGVDDFLAGSSPMVREQTLALFDILDTTPVRALATGLWTRIPDATPEQVHAMLERLRTSSIGLLHSVYGGLLQMAAFAWYLDETHFADTGYPGPPKKVIA